MTLRLKMGLQIMAMIVGLLVVSGTALWGLDALHEDYGLAVAGYQELREVFEVGSHLAIARTLLLPGHIDRSRAAREVEVAGTLFDLFTNGQQFPGSQTPGGKRPRVYDPAAAAAVEAALRDAAKQLGTPPELEASVEVIAADSSAISTAIAKISSLSSGIRATIEAHQLSARHKRDVTIRAVAIVSAAVVLAALLLGIMQYLGVMLPLGGLRTGVRRIAAGHFAQRLAPRGSEEFVELANEFNRMASELDGFYHQLEEKVAQKSKELIRSERLASVGYLAAGVAHEINNPLGIISGYAEYSLEQLKARQAGAAAPDGQADDELGKSLQIICEEAFRCKDITGKLLSLARQGDQTRQNICVADVADNVVSIVGGLREYRDRKLTVTAPAGAAERQELSVNAVEAEMKQVVLNLTLNALEASPAGTGEVRIAVRRVGESVECSVTDNGRGMSVAILERVFEPFFTEKRGSADARGSRSHGTGLGLSITHAIIENHGGSIVAQSEGVGKGSRFVVLLPGIDRDHTS
jgi:signal transduction histidine kinase